MTQVIKTEDKTTTYEFLGDSVNRFYFDRVFSLRDSEKGWEQWDTDQDSAWFGVWVNISKLTVVTFAEGDLTTEVYNSQEAMKRGFKHMVSFYGPPPVVVTTINTDGTVTHFSADRPSI